VLKDD